MENYVNHVSGEYNICYDSQKIKRMTHNAYMSTPE